MFRLDIDFFPLLILVPIIVQFTICLLAGKKNEILHRDSSVCIFIFCGIWVSCR